jgi:transglutaminase-like putative cysteine protease
MNKLILAALLSLGPVFIGVAQTNIVSEASKLEGQGQFKQASAVLQGAIDSKKYSGAELKKLEFEIDRLERIKDDYSLTKEGLFQEIKQSIKGLTREEFESWVKEGWMDGREIDGTLYFFDSGVSNLYFRHPELNARRIEPVETTEKERLRLEWATSIRKAALAAKTPYVLPKTFHVTMNVTANANCAAPGEMIRAWLPIPRKYPFQTDFKLLSSTWPPKKIADENSPIRSIYFEEPAQKDKPTQFKVEYEYTMRGVSFDLDPGKIQPYDSDADAVKRFTCEAPHVVFSPEIKALSAKIMGNEKNPMLKAKKIYDWLSDNLMYSYALEYSTIRNISEYCRSKGYGDCGQQALLFITLCRYNGVPARWQSGWDLFPQFTSNHDWAEIYLAPYGWVPVDQYCGNYAMRYIKTLTQAQKLQIRDFYFGGLDQYRMAANSDHNQILDPPKQSFRSDDVDFQRGELEAGGKNLYFGDFFYSLHYKEVPAPSIQ